MKKLSQLISIMIIMTILSCNYQASATSETVYKTDTNIILSGEPMQYNNSPYYIGIEKETENILILNKLDSDKYIWIESSVKSIDELDTLLQGMDFEEENTMNGSDVIIALLVMFIVVFTISSDD